MMVPIQMPLGLYFVFRRVTRKYAVETTVILDSAVVVIQRYGSAVRFQVLTTAAVRMTASWHVASCSLVEVDR
jgi:hypothetical protein